MVAEVGRLAPDFTLPGTDGTESGRRDYSLSEHRGQLVVLVFYPDDNTTVCTRQLSSYNHDIDLFTSVGAEVLAISPQSVDSHEAFSLSQGGFAFPLLADSDKSVGESYGIVGRLGFYRRSAFVVDAEGVVRYAHKAVAGLTFRSSNELVTAVREAGA